ASREGFGGFSFDLLSEFTTISASRRGFGGLSFDLLSEFTTDGALSELNGGIYFDLLSEFTTDGALSELTGGLLLLAPHVGSARCTLNSLWISPKKATCWRLLTFLVALLT
ncbi:MAG: hypothetical protein K6G65_07340, partial [Lachnospiraceae bacterium]|nr:hypothetical protein [Lachnospiraceae bacterium]